MQTILIAFLISTVASFILSGFALYSDGQTLDLDFLIYNSINAIIMGSVATALFSIITFLIK